MSPRKEQLETTVLILQMSNVTKLEENNNNFQQINSSKLSMISILFDNDFKGAKKKKKMYSHTFNAWTSRHIVTRTSACLGKECIPELIELSNCKRTVNKSFSVDD